MDRTYTIDELWAAVRRRWKTLAVVAFGVVVLAALVIARLPNEYRARALVMVEPFTPHPDLVIPVVNSLNLEQKVKSVREGIYARSVMATAIDELKLYPREREKSMDEAVTAFRADTEVHAEGENAFSITVRSRNPETAARAANRLAELYIEGNLQVRAGQVIRTRDIITQKLAEMRGELAQAESKVTAFKRANANSLPELIDARFHQRDELAKQMELEETFIKEAQRRIDLLGTQPFGKDTEVGRLEELYDTVRARLATLQASLTPDHPDVESMKRELESTGARLQNARARAAANDLELRRMNEAIARGRNRIADLQKRQAEIDKLIAGAPLVAADLAELTRDTDMIKAKVTQLISKKAEAEITADLEQKSGPSAFRVLESAQPPALPSSPNRQQALMLALLGALVLGIAVSMGQELSDRSIRSESEVGTALALPVLACVPELNGAGTVALLPMQQQAEA
jgi:polysaccharide chain length determinant protein (PEP-CTERM system associated)